MTISAMTKRRSCPLLASTTMLQLAGALPAFAQTASSLPAAALAANSIDEIIVTACKRAESLEAAPLSITAVGGERLTQPRGGGQSRAAVGINPEYSNRTQSADGFHQHPLDRHGGEPRGSLSAGAFVASIEEPRVITHKELSNTKGRATYHG